MSTFVRQFFGYLSFPISLQQKKTEKEGKANVKKVTYFDSSVKVHMKITNINNPFSVMTHIMLSKVKLTEGN